MKRSISTDRVRKVLSYDPATGVFRWKVKLSIRGPVGSVAGGSRANGYRVIGIDGTQLMAHRLAWVFITGNWPDGIIDHADGDRSNNSAANLRAATQSQNLANARRHIDNTSGAKGVTWDAARSKWVATLKCGGTLRKKRFELKDDAAAAYERWSKELFGEFARAA